MENEKKYDTNPLDPAAARRAEAAWSDDEDPTRALPQRDTLRQGDLTEDAPTRQFAGASGGYEPYPTAAPPPTYQTPYAPPYQTPYQPSPYPNAPFQPPPPPLAASGPPSKKPTSRTAEGLNLPENVLLIAPYIPFYVGAIAALVELVVTPRQEKRVRFHAAQGLAMHLAVMLIPFILSLARNIGGLVGAWTGPLRLVAAIFSAAAAVYFIIKLVKVWKGEDEPVEMLAGITRWLQENIAPKEK